MESIFLFLNHETREKNFVYFVCLVVNNKINQIWRVIVFFMSYLEIQVKILTF